MPHSRFFVDAPLKEDSLITLEGDEHHHMMKVMRLKPGESVEIVNGCGYLAYATLKDYESKRASCLVEKVLFKEKPSCSFIIAQALLKPALLEWTVEKNTELGATAMWMFPAQNSEKEQLSSHLLQRLHKHTLSALKQCGRLYLPEIRYYPSLTELLSMNDLEIFYGDVSSKAPPLRNVKLDKSKTILFVVGPEQGFHDKEVQLLKSRKAQGVSLHENILRAETASIVASAILSTAILHF